VRDVYDLGDRLLIVASDRISAYDFVLPTPIPDKGKILTQMSNFWFRKLADVCPNHLIATEIADFPEPLQPFRERLEGRSVLVAKAKRVDIECVVRGYLAGSAWAEYKAGGTVCGARLAAGLVESAKLPEPLFTPATKAPDGQHDENISFERMEALVGKERAAELRRLSLALFKEASRWAESRRFLLADTKFEFGEIMGRPVLQAGTAPSGGRLTLIDEALTPDSSRFWDAGSYIKGRPQEAFDKQYVRDYLNKINWARRPPAPALPPEVVEKTREKYMLAYTRLTGRKSL
jgi:phosphoribosylaminoimidazole-succinocarboxamide synthase